MTDGPAFMEGGTDSSVKLTNPSDHRGARNLIQSALAKAEIKICDTVQVFIK